MRTRLFGGKKLMHAQRAPGPQLQDYNLERKHEERVAAESTSGCKRIGGGECEDTSCEDASIRHSGGPHLAAFPKRLPAPAADSCLHRPRLIESVIAQQHQATLAAHSGRSRPKRKTMKPV
jgi:hypothetical protein